MSYSDRHTYTAFWFDTPDTSPEHPAVADWQAHVDAGRVGANPPCPPEVAANRDATTRYFAEIARDRRRAARENRA